MPVVRGYHSFDDQFTQIPNAWLRDARLSFKARGLLSLVMSHTQGWSLTIGQLATQNQEGKDAIRSAIAELEQFGYLSREQINQNGRFGEVIWTTHDPSATPVADYPLSENPLSENPLYKNNNSKEEQVKNIYPHLEELFNEFWNAYPRKLDKAKAFRAFKSALNRAKFEDILAGVIAYRNDPKRNPDFTKYPASWLNADSWENAASTPEGSVWREKAIKHSNEFLEEQKKLIEQAAPAPKCEHGKNLALCPACLKKIS
jgi:hypothetical protein